jgi:hypothetical protein
MSPVNVLIMIHGMSPESGVRSPFDSKCEFWGYDKFWNALVSEDSSLETLFPARFKGIDGKLRNFIGVEWGHELVETPVDQLRNDQQLMKAQNFLDDTIGYNQLKKYKQESGVSDENQQVIWDFPPGLLRPIIIPLRQQIITRGMGDVVYYTSRAGECQIRRAVYHQVLSQLAPFLPEPDVRFHLIGQSLGVTICHDFLYGLFSRGEKSGYIRDEQYQNQEDKDQFIEWFKKASPGDNTLNLGSFTSTASQIPLFLMRKQELVTQLAKGEQIDAAGIGVEDSGRIQWQLFFDVDDILGFATRRLYNCQQAIREIQVNSGSGIDAHTGYWQNRTVIQETSALLARNAQQKSIQ